METKHESGERDSDSGCRASPCVKFRDRSLVLGGGRSSVRVIGVKLLPNRAYRWRRSRTNIRRRLRRRRQQRLQKRIGGPSLFATAVEVDGLRRTLTDHMKIQDEHNRLMVTNMEQITAYLNRIAGQPGVVSHSDKASNIQGNGISPPSVTSVFPHAGLQQPSVKAAPVSSPNVDANVITTSKTSNNLPTQPENFVPIPTGWHHYDETPVDSPTFNHHINLKPIACHTLNLHTNFHQLITTNNTFSHGHITYHHHPQNYYRPPISHPPPPPPQQHNPPPPEPPNQNNNYDQYVRHQQRMVARGPKLDFPEFDGEDPDGDRSSDWCRDQGLKQMREEKFEREIPRLVSFPAEHRRSPESPAAGSCGEPGADASAREELIRRRRSDPPTYLATALTRPKLDVGGA